MPEYLYPGVYVEETETRVSPIPGVSTSIDGAALESLAFGFRQTLAKAVGEWTDRNESDPGVTLLEVFAFLAEGLLFRANEIPDRGRPAALRAAAALAALGQAAAPGDEGLKRPLFFSGRLLDASTLASEQDYHRKKLRRLIRSLLGSGVISGLSVRVEPPSASSGERIVVEPGLAIDPRGEEVCLPGGATLAAPAQGDCAFVTVRYWERPCQPPSTAEDLPTARPSVEEACVVGVSPTAAAPAIPLARLVRSEGRWQVDPTFVPPHAHLEP